MMTMMIMMVTIEEALRRMFITRLGRNTFVLDKKSLLLSLFCFRYKAGQTLGGVTLARMAMPWGEHGTRACSVGPVLSKPELAS